MVKSDIIWVSFFGATAVLLGAFGAHGLEARLSPDQLDTFETGVRYQFYHMFGLFLLAVLTQQTSADKLSAWIRRLFIFGIFLFSGSIYLLACKDLLGISSWKWLGPITPIGGTCFIIAWILLGVKGVKSNEL